VWTFAGSNGSGDWGMLDQFAGLKLIHENIAVFGGDPNHITVMNLRCGITICTPRHPSTRALGMHVFSLWASHNIAIRISMIRITHCQYSLMGVYSAKFG
jgi:hypothetical protein